MLSPMNIWGPVSLSAFDAAGIVEWRDAGGREGLAGNLETAIIRPAFSRRVAPWSLPRWPSGWTADRSKESEPSSMASALAAPRAAVRDTSARRPRAQLPRKRLLPRAERLCADDSTG